MLYSRSKNDATFPAQFETYILARSSSTPHHDTVTVTVTALTVVPSLHPTPRAVGERERILFVPASSSH